MPKLESGEETGPATSGNRLVKKLFLDTTMEHLVLTWGSCILHRRVASQSQDDFAWKRAEPGRFDKSDSKPRLMDHAESVGKHARRSVSSAGDNTSGVSFQCEALKWVY